MPLSFACAVLFLLSELIKVKLQLRTLLGQPESGSANGNSADDEHFKDATTEAFDIEKEESDDDEDTTEEAGSSKLDDGLTDAERSAKILAKMFGKPEKESKKTKEAAVVSFDDEPVSKKENKEEEGGYDASKRNPLFAGAETSCAWEIQMLAHHYHPSVQSFTRQLLDNKDTGIQYAGDPLVDFTMHAFFEKFVNKKPRHKVAEASGNNGAKAKNWTFAPINSEAVLQENEANVDASDQFFYKFFKERASRDSEHPNSRRTKSKSDREMRSRTWRMTPTTTRLVRTLRNRLKESWKTTITTVKIRTWRTRVKTRTCRNSPPLKRTAMKRTTWGSTRRTREAHEDEDGFDCSIIGADDDDEVLQEEQELKTKRKIQTKVKDLEQTKGKKTK
ncbi:hypothetical protein DVH05_015751 [Phytophthora capsici]|nr:hypothetical protein DVH05_015751 [Phytophthora capsici]